MKVKVECPCGTRFGFEVEPINGWMPMSVHCPACGAEATEAANAVIQVQLAGEKVESVEAAPPPRPVAPPPAEPPVPPPVSAGLRISRHAPEPAGSSAEAASGPAEEEFERCHRHKTEPAVEHCRVCGKAICQTCLEQFGFVCSIFCREAAAHKKIDVPVYAGQRGLVTERAHRKAKYLALGVAAIVAALIGGWVWYTWFARDPHVVYSLDIPKTGTGLRAAYKQDEFYDLIAPNQLLAIKSKNISLMDVTKQSQIWSAPLEGVAYGFDDEYGFGGSHVTVTSNDVWVSYSGGVARFDRQTGKRNDPVIPGKTRNVIAGDEMLLVISRNDQGREALTRVTLPEGELQTEEGSAPPTNAAAKPVVKGQAGAPLKKPAATGPTAARPGMANQLKALVPGTTAGAPDDDVALEQLAMFEDLRSPYVAAGRSVIEFKSKLLEQKTLTREAMKKPKGKSILDGNITADRGLDLAEEMMNDATRERTGGVEIEDVSRYQVTLHRWFAKDAPDWTGEVIGPSELAPMKTVDLLLAGTNLLVFGRDNKKLWDAKLTFSIAARHFFKDGRYPCLETKGALYFADKGMLTRFDTASGNVRWRLTSVGISAIQADDRGRLYVDTTTAAPESVQFSQQVNIREQDRRVILQLDPESGKILWRFEFPGSYYHAMPAGKFLYSTRMWQTQDALKLEEGPDSHFNLKLLEPANGKMVWNYPQTNRRLVKAEVQQNWILLQFEDRVMVLKFFSL